MSLGGYQKCQDKWGVLVRVFHMALCFSHSSVPQIGKKPDPIAATVSSNPPAAKITQLNKQILARVFTCFNFIRVEIGTRSLHSWSLVPISLPCAARSLVAAATRASSASRLSRASRSSLLARVLSHAQWSHSACSAYLAGE